MEGNKHAWHSTLHSAHDHSGLGAGLGGGTDWNGPRDWTAQDYGPGARCIDTLKPFNVAVSFPASMGGQLHGMTVKLTQKGKDCPLSVSLNNYDGMAEIQKALELGMTPVISYWKAKDMLWLDGKGSDGKGPCSTDSDRCGDSVKFYNFKLEAMSGQPPLPPTTSVLAPFKPSIPPISGTAEIVMLPPVLPTVEPPAVATLPPVPTLPSVEMLPTVPAMVTLAPMMDTQGKCSAKGQDCRQARCCAETGMQCYQKDQWWAGCRKSCQPGAVNPDDAVQWQQPWSCTPLGPRTPYEAPFGAFFAGLTVQRMAAVVVGMLALIGAGFWIWRSRATKDNGGGRGLGLPGTRPARTGREELQQGSPSTARGRLAEQLSRSPPTRGHGQSPRAIMQYPFIGAAVKVQHPVTPRWQLAPTTPQLVQSP